MKQYLPNIITIFRLLLIPLFWWSFRNFSLPYGSELATFIFIVAAISDYYDGKFARKYKLITNFGKIMDPIADKFLVIAALLVFYLKPVEYINIWVLIIIILREVIVTLLRAYQLKRGIVVSANYWGKLKTGFQIAAIITSLVIYIFLSYVHFPMHIENYFVIFIKFFFWLTVVITVVSGITYFKFK